MGATTRMMDDEVQMQRRIIHSTDNMSILITNRFNRGGADRIRDKH